MTNKELYKALCRKEPRIPIFSQWWWLDAVCGERNWDVVMIIRGGSVLAAMPYYYECTHHMRKIVMPVLTQSMGPWLNYPAGQKLHTRLSFEKECLTELIEMLPPFDVFHQNFHYSVSNWLPFYWKGYKQSSRYTYVLEMMGGLETIFNGFKENIKREIRKASRCVDVMCNDEGIVDFYRMDGLTFQRQGLSIPYTLEFVKGLDAACAENKCRRIFFARGKNNGPVHAAAYIIWDSTSAYYLMGGSDPQYRGSGAGSLLLWNAIQFASTVAKEFDFEGSMLASVERFFRSFGAAQRSYFQINKVNSRWLTIVQGLRNLRGARFS